jgi:hypothetical protein
MELSTRFEKLNSETKVEGTNARVLCVLPLSKTIVWMKTI